MNIHHYLLKKFKKRNLIHFFQRFGTKNEEKYIYIVVIFSTTNAEIIGDNNRG